VLSCNHPLKQGKGTRIESKRRTTIARIVPLPLLRYKETRFGSVLPSCLVDISAVIGPLVVWRVRFLRSLSEDMPGDGGGGGMERSRMNCPSTGISKRGSLFNIQT
jgi:hypothetical protein